MFLNEANKQIVADIPKTSLDEVKTVIRTKRDRFGKFVYTDIPKAISQFAEEAKRTASNFASISSPMNELMKTKNDFDQVGTSLRDAISKIDAAHLFGSLK